MKPILGNEELYLVGIRTNPDVSDPQIYTLYVDDERPILRDGEPLFFTRPDNAQNALLQSDCGAMAIGPAPRELYAVFDIASCLYIIESQDETPNGNVLDCINLLLDFTNLFAHPMPGQYRDILEGFADHLTFDLQFAGYLDEHKIHRNTIIDAIYWCLGAIVCHARIVDARSSR